jgi:hypothetical protein
MRERCSTSAADLDERHLFTSAKFPERFTVPVAYYAPCFVETDLILQNRTISMSEANLLSYNRPSDEVTKRDGPQPQV